MAFPTITGVGTGSGIAFSDAKDQYDNLFGNCPSGLVEIPPINTSGNSGYLDGSVYRHEIMPSGGSGINLNVSI